MRRPLRGLALFASLMAAVGPSACRQVAGITQSPPEALTSTACGIGYGTTACASCVNASCCGASSACAGVTVCAGYEECLGKCNGDPECRSKCASDAPPGTGSEISTLSACIDAHCESACGLSCGSIAPIVSLPAAADACQKCVAKDPGYCASARACGASAACDRYLRCFLACFTPDCRFACADADPEGASLFASFQAEPHGELTYFDENCATACGAGTNWSCVGHVVWPAPLTPTVTLGETAVDNQTSSPVVGLQLAVCAGCPCPSASNPLLGTARTDDAGAYSVTIPNRPTISLGVNGCVQVDPDADSGVVGEFLYWGYPLSAATAEETDPRDFSRTVTSTEFANNLSIVGVPVDESRGLDVQAVIHDCLGVVAPGMTLSLASYSAVAAPEGDAGITPFFARGGNGSITATETDTSGIAGLLNVPPGEYILTASIKATGVAVSQVYVTVEKGTITGVLMWPTP